MTIRIAILDASRSLADGAMARLRAHADDLAAELASRFQARGEVRVRIVDDSAMAEAHQRHAGVPGTTDVLTFDLRGPETGPTGARADSPPIVDADILICADEALRQSDARNTPVERELLLYILHGLLHTLGHDDHDDEAYARMHAAEDEILRAIGVGPVFGAGEKPGASDPV